MHSNFIFFSSALRAPKGPRAGSSRPFETRVRGLLTECSSGEGGLLSLWPILLIQTVDAFCLVKKNNYCLRITTSHTSQLFTRSFDG